MRKVHITTSDHMLNSYVAFLPVQEGLSILRTPLPNIYADDSGMYLGPVNTIGGRIPKVGWC